MNDKLQSFIFETETKLESIAGSDIRYGISSTSRVHLRTPGSNEDQVVFSWILCGRGSFTEDGREYRLTDMCYCLRRPGRDWRMYLDDSRSVRLFLDLPYSLYPALELMIPELAKLPPVREFSFRSALLDEFLNLRDDLNRTSLTGFYNILPRVVHFIMNLTGILEERERSPMMRARALLEDVTSRLTLEEIAGSCGLNYNTFRRRFADTFGTSPGKYRLTCRMAEARSALAAGEGIASIADRLGFADVYSFTHSFTEAVGVPPARYRDDL